ncbi:MAG TPA: S41 family peptidase [Steroidobacteraceae bacterium]|nr:S41 family peptidase [Steroidobacteraceae bacterium]
MRQTSMLVSVLAIAAAFTVRAQAPHTTASAAVAIPNTLAGRALATWLQTFNSGDRKELESYYKTYRPDVPVDTVLGFRNETGGFDLVSIYRSEPRHIEFLATDRANHNRSIGELDVNGRHPERVSNIAFVRIAADSKLIGFLIDDGDRARVIHAIASKVNQLYVLADTGEKMALDITSKWRHGQYDSITDGDTFAQQLTKELQVVSHDKHLSVAFSPIELPPVGPGPSASSIARQWAQLQNENCGFKRIEWLPGNIGYLRFDVFGDPSVCAPTAIAAMGFLANVDAIIFDLRDNHGGSPDLVTLLESYLFASPTHLDDFWARPSGQTSHTWTLANLPGKRLPSVPVYVLTSHETFSGGEAFAYELQALKRATVVGEETGGGGHLVRPERVDARFMLLVPSAEPINPITKTNWEGTGVVPDVKVAAAQALDVAEKLAAAALAKRRSDQQTTE